MGLSIKEEEVVGFENSTQNGCKDVKKKKGVSSKKSGGFQSMGLSFPVLKGIEKKGYKIPTPIQRKTIPIVLEGRDVVAMARTGSGKTACFLIPLFEKLKSHALRTGIRAIILSPTRELALQTLKFTKELGKFTGLRSAVILGGDSMESQFGVLLNNPDIVIATPGRFLHVCVEMELKLNNVEYIVFDEADRLFEMGFGEQLREIVQRIPESRQTLLFSATLPKVLVEFSRAGLSEPVLLRLDVETKIPDTLDLAFLSCRSEEKPAALLCLLKYVVKSEAQTIVFAATKHHVEYLHSLLEHAGIPNSFIYSDLDASARKINVAKFRTGKVSVMVVTDVAARGIDIPQLDYVINYNFPAKPKLFVHRVGRCARAGRQGTAICLVSTDELCYMIDLHLFLGRNLEIITPGSNSDNPPGIGKIPQNLLEVELNEISIWQSDESDLDSLRKVSENAYKQYIRSRPGASIESVKRSKEVAVSSAGDHWFFKNVAPDESEKANLVVGISSYRPQGTIFEIGQSSKSVMYNTMKRKREMHNNKIISHKEKQIEKKETKDASNHPPAVTLEMSKSEDVGEVFSSILTGKRKGIGESLPKAKRTCFIDKNHFIPYQPKDHLTEEGLAVNNFVRDARAAGLDLTADTESSLKAGVTRKVWDKKKKKMVGVNDRSKAGKIRSESGAWIPATFKSGRFKQWVEKTKAASVDNHDGDDVEHSRPMRKQQPNTHWGRHNLKETQKKLNLRLKKPEQIVKERLEKEKRQRKSGKKKKRSKPRK